MFLFYAFFLSPGRDVLKQFLLCFQAHSAHFWRKGSGFIAVNHGGTLRQRAQIFDQTTCKNCLTCNLHVVHGLGHGYSRRP